MLLRALRDFNVGKIGADDTNIFMGLLNDLFPRTVELVPRAVDVALEAKVWSLSSASPLRDRAFPASMDLPCVALTASPLIKYLHTAAYSATVYSETILNT